MQAKFTQGSIFKHITAMTAASTMGLLSLFLVDFIDLYWLSLLNNVELTAAIGFSASILFFTLSISIGLSIGCAALVSQAIGRGDAPYTRSLVVHIIVCVLILTAIVAFLTVFSVTPLLRLLGASAGSMVYANQYLTIILPSMPLLALAMVFNGVLRAAGQAKTGMVLTLIGGAVNAILDPILIFGLDMDIKGAAWATVGSRVAMVVFGFYFVAIKDNYIGGFVPSRFTRDLKKYLTTAFPAVLTNLSTPIGLAYVTAVMAQFGDAIVSGNAIVTKLQPLAFAGLFALSGAVGPIAGQNFGALQFIRIRETLTKSLEFILYYSLIACAILFVACDMIIAVFGAQGGAADVIRWFCYGLSLTFIFNGATFVTNAMFNNLNAAPVATTFNFTKATFGTIPFAYFGAQWGGPFGVLVGVLIGSILIAIAGTWYAYHYITRLENKQIAEQADAA